MNNAFFYMVLAINLALLLLLINKTNRKNKLLLISFALISFVTCSITFGEYYFYRLYQETKSVCESFPQGQTLTNIENILTSKNYKFKMVDNALIIRNQDCSCALEFNSDQLIKTYPTGCNN